MRRTGASASFAGFGSYLASIRQLFKKRSACTWKRRCRPCMHWKK